MWCRHHIRPSPLSCRRRRPRCRRHVCLRSVGWEHVGLRALHRSKRSLLGYLARHAAGMGCRSGCRSDVGDQYYKSVRVTSYQHRHVKWSDAHDRPLWLLQCTRWIEAKPKMSKRMAFMHHLILAQGWGKKGGVILHKCAFGSEAITPCVTHGEWIWISSKAVSVASSDVNRRWHVCVWSAVVNDDVDDSTFVWNRVSNRMSQIREMSHRNKCVSDCAKGKMSAVQSLPLVEKRTVVPGMG